jgi:threonylcarbamoyladenosine tRNA methylthiotransferase MtaB
MFRASLDFVTSISFARLHVFPYSPRPGTAASLLPGPVSAESRQARARAMRELGTQLASGFREQFVGREMTVLWEQRRRDGLWSGLTDNYLRVTTDSDLDLLNRLVPARLVAAQDGSLVGELLE